MPPPSIKTVRQIIYYQYAKIISEASGFGITNYGVILARCKQLELLEIHWSSSVRDWLKENEVTDTCIYCGEKQDLTVEHIPHRSCVAKTLRIMWRWCAKAAIRPKAANAYTSEKVKTNSTA